MKISLARLISAGYKIMWMTKESTEDILSYKERVEIRVLTCI